MTGADQDRAGMDIAIVGMAGRFPGAPDVETFWANVRDGVESIRALSDEELLAAGVSRAQLDDPDYVRASPVLEDIDRFDAAFFGFSPRDASVMDPAHRIFLEIAWQAIENAGYTALPEEGAVGVFAGSGAPLYMIENLRTNPELMASMGEFLVRHTGNDMNFLATRVSYEMDLRGPSINVQTACSSALVSVHLACRSLAQGDCVMALAGGSTVLVPGGQGYLYKDGEILSPDGHCRPFDAESAGTVFGSGAGVVVLKRLSDALDDGDTIHAVIKGSAVNNDGAMKVGYLAPGVEGQAAVVDAALTAAGVEADTVSYIETHGTGTLVGDPIEVEALNQAYRPRTAKRRYCAIGSVKSNIGHLGEAAAAASLIKAVMALKHRQLPPSLGYETPNPAIDFDDSPFFVNDKLRDWSGEGGPLRAGVTALGAGGTNCHLVLEEAPPALPGDGARDRQLVVLSARTKTALDRASDNLAAALEADPDLDLADAAYTLSVGRRPMAHRRALAAADRTEAIARLRERDPKTVVTDEAKETSPGLVFMFPGGGAQYAGMGADLYAAEPVYAEAVDKCLAIAAPLVGRDLRPLMFPSAEERDAATRTLERPSLALPALFTVEYAMALLFQAWGASPEAFIGHSMGEYVAACLSGVMSLDDALKLVATRGQLFETVPAGAMTSAPMSEAGLSALLPAGVSIAAVNAPDLAVASGPVEAIEALEARLAKEEVDTTRIRIDVAAHSGMLDAILEPFRAVCRTIAFQPPSTPFVSNVTGTWITAAQAVDPNYWVDHLRSTVRFADGLEALLSTGGKVLVEIGPGRTLSMLAKAQRTPQKHAFNSMRHPQEQASDLAYALTTFGRLWAAGAAVDWHAFYDGQLRNRVPLPAYPFEGKSYWVAPGAPAGLAAAGELRKREDVRDWFYGVGFAEAPLIRRADGAASQRWLIVSQSAQAVRDLEMALAPDVVSVAVAGPRLASDGPGRWRFDLEAPDQYVDLLRALEEDGRLPQHVVFLADPRPAANAGEAVARQFLHPVWLAQALGGLEGPTQLSVVTAGLSGLGDQALDPARALALGPVFVAPREFAQLSARCIDLPAVPPAGERGRRLADQLVEELRAQSPDRLVALRPGARFVQQVSPLSLAPLPAGGAPRAWLREGGVYLVTGGLGGVGLEIARHLAGAKPVKLALLSRQGLPPEADWEAILAQRPSSQAARRIRKVRELRGLGAQVLTPAGDVADRASLEAALRQVRAAFGPLNGVIHAAGVMDDAPMLAKTPDAMRRVLAPKVAGALALDALVTERLDLFVVFSSVASFLGLPGQVDYAAANAFLDAFARERAQRAPGRTLSIDWNAWRDVGMAAEARRGQAHALSNTHEADHPVLDGYRDEGGERVFESLLSTDSHWLLDEHRIKGGSALLPGTAFVEIARAAFAQGRGPGPVELSDLDFLGPFQVPDGETRRMSVRVASQRETSEIAIAADADETPVVIGQARAYVGPAPAPLDIAAVSARCTAFEVAPADRFLPQDFVAFGPRWANIVRTRYGAGEALSELELDARFAADLGSYGLHPAVLDMATGGAQALIPGVDLAKDFFVPLGYGRVRVFADMPRHVFSHVRVLPETGGDLAYFDVDLAGADGAVFAQISRFTMKRVDAGSALSAPAGRRSRRESARHDALAVLLREAIAPAEGVEAFDRIMAQPGLVQAVASSVDVNLWLRQLAAEAAGPAATAAPGGFERPELAADYAAPSSGVEQALAAVWSELLGVRQVGVRDDFFDLGGNSLVAVRMFAAIRKQFRVSLPLATLFEAPTIADLAGLLAHHGVGADEAKGEAAQAPARPATFTAKAWSPLVRIKAGAAGQTPFFCVHGAGGNVMAFQPLAQLLPAETPFYGLQAQGVDGELPFHTSIDAMAENYLAAVRAAQPDGPYRLGGYSGGGLVAMEMAQRLRRDGAEVELLVFFDSLAAPEAQTKVTWRNKLALARRIPLEFILHLPYQRTRHHLDAWRVRRGAAGRKLFAANRLEVIGAEAWQSFWRAQQVYRPAAYDGDALLFRATNTGIASQRAGETLGWNKVIGGRVDVVHVRAWHETIFQPPSVNLVAAELAARLKALDAARRAPPPRIPAADGERLARTH